MSRIMTPQQSGKPATAQPSRPMPQAPPAPQKTPPPKMAMPTPGAVTGRRVVLVATEGYGKTTVGALGASPVFIVAPNELGYFALYEHGLVPACPVMQPKSWPEVLAAIEFIAREPGECKTLVLDAMVGLESLCASYICQTQYDGDWSKKGFMSYQEGPKVVTREFPAIFPRLSACARKGVDVLILGHAKTQPFANPEGGNYDRFECNVAKEVWALTKAWAEAVLFGNFRAIIDEARPESNIAKAKGKAIGQQRILRCQYSALADAKNQYGLAAEYGMPDSPDEFAQAFWGLIKPSASPAPSQETKP